MAEPRAPMVSPEAEPGNGVLSAFSNSHFEILKRRCRINAAFRNKRYAAFMRQRLQNEIAEVRSQ